MDARQEKAQRLATAILDAAAFRGVEYADVRIFLDDLQEKISMSVGVVVTAPEYCSDSGVGIRVLFRGAWGFSSFPNFHQPLKALNSQALRCLKEAMGLARDAAYAPEERIVLAPLQKLSEQVSWEAPCLENPFSVSRAEKIEILRRCDRAMAKGSKLLSTSICALEFWAVETLFASWAKRDGYRFIRQKLGGGGLSLYVYASKDSDIQERSDGFGKNMAGGFEIIRALDVENAGLRIAQDVERLLSADECPEGIMDVILLPDQAGLHIHETVHGLEADRIFGYEDSYIGGTFASDLVPEIGQHEFGPEGLNLVADARLPGGYGTFGFDDEGVPAQKFFLVEKGILKNLLTSRETVPQLNRLLGREHFGLSNGTMRAYSYSRIPLIRMTNISLLPGEETLNSLIARVERGIILTGSLSWSMSEDRKNFDFGLQEGLLVQGGKIVKVVKNPGYRGNNLAFWKSLDVIGSADEVEMLNIPNCGKGHPAQYRRLGHGSPPALFRNVFVYNRKAIRQGGKR